MASSGRAVAGVALLACTVMSTSAAHGAEAAIDSFIDASAQTQYVSNANVLQNTVGSTTRDDAGLQDVIGGTRTLTVSADSLASGADFVVAGVSPMPVPLLVYNSSNFADGLVELLYDAGGAGLNAFLAFAMGVRVRIVSADLAAVALPGLDVTVTLVDTNAASASSTQTVLLPVTPVTPLDLDFAFADFAGVDPGSLFSIRIGVDPQIAGDLELAMVETFGTPNVETICDDGIDNNNNGFTDCDDSACTIAPECAYQAPALTPGALSGALALLSLVGWAAIRRRLRG